MGMDTAIRRGHPITFGALVVFSIIEMSIAAWITGRFNSHHNYPSTTVRDRVRYTLFCSIWTIVFGTAYLAMFLMAAQSAFASVASHFVFLIVTWIFWLAAASSVTAMLGGGMNCSSDNAFVYCGQLNALEGFAWLIWVLLTFMLIIVIIRGIKSSKRGDGYGGSLVSSLA